MNIPNFIIEKAGALGIEERGKFFSAVIAYMNSGDVPEWLEGDIEGFFMSAKMELDPVLRRRRRDAARRLRKKQEKLQAMQQQSASTPQPHPQPQPESQSRPQSEPESLPIPQAQKHPDARADEDPTLHPRLSRRDRRKLMREEAKKRRVRNTRLFLPSSVSRDRLKKKSGKIYGKILPY